MIATKFAQSLLCTPFKPVFSRVLHQHGWGYTKKNGPHVWAKIFPDAKGKQQSPIDCPQTSGVCYVPKERLDWSYATEDRMKIRNTGRYWKVEINGHFSEMSGGPFSDTYLLKEFLCHWGGSEHAIRGKRYDGELQFIHWNVSKYRNFQEACHHSDGLACFAVLLKTGEPGGVNKVFDQLIRPLKEIPYKCQWTYLKGPFNPTNLIPQKSGYYVYDGSLTVPPCTECVRWVVFKKTLDVSRLQLDACRKLCTYELDEERPVDEFFGYLPQNVRPLQPIGARKVYDFDTELC